MAFLPFSPTLAGDFEFKAAFFGAGPPWGNGSKRKAKKSPALGAEKRTGPKPVPQSHQRTVCKKQTGLTRLRQGCGVQASDKKGQTGGLE